MPVCSEGLRDRVMLLSSLLKIKREKEREREKEKE
jgi:hypothetical protein